MRLLTDVKIENKVIGLLLLLGVVSTGLAIFTSSRIAEIGRRYAVLTDHSLPANTDIARANRRATEMVLAGFKGATAANDRTKTVSASELLETAYTKGSKNLASAVETDPNLAADIAPIKKSFTHVHDLAADAIHLASIGQAEDANRVLADADAAAEALVKSTSELVYKRVATATEQTKATERYSSSTSRSALILNVLGLILAVVVSVFVTRIGISRPLARLQGVMRGLADGNNHVEVADSDRKDEVGQMAQAVLVLRESGRALERAAAEKRIADADQKRVVDTVSMHLSELSHGDLTASITTDFPGEYAALKSNYNEAIAKLRDLIGSVSNSAAMISTGSVEIAQASENLARRTESNAASLEQTSAALAQIDSRLRASADASIKTVSRADKAIGTVSGGRSTADEAVQAMGRVSDSAKGIDSVIEGLDKIAFQTRVLAMNAAVEAGRAGDAGRGFAVVADLVSALAMRAEEEAKRARDQLTVTQTEIVTAVDAVQKVDGALTAISDDVGQVHTLLAGMASDNQAQSVAITQISAAVGTMDDATQQNAAMVEETSAAARNLSVEVGNLAEQAGRFTITGGTRPATRPAPSAPRRAAANRPMANVPPAPEAVAYL
jgi:methyl-accepting chemotaxis protein